MSRALNGALISAFSMPGPLPLMLMAVACVVVGAARANAADSPARRPNVIFILTDDQGWGDGHFAGHPYVKTPHLDRLAREGTWFRQFYVAATVCSPSRAAFMTSHYPARHAIHGHFATDESNAARSMPNWLDPDVTTLPDLLKTVGYATAHFGKWHLGGGRNAPAPEQYGFDESKTVNSSGPSLGDEGKTPYFRAESTRLIVDETIDFIRRRHEAGPFYANVWTLLPHAHLKPTPEQLAVYAGLEPKADDPAFGPWMRKYLSAAEDLRSQMQVFCASLTDLDTQIGRLLDVLDELGIADDTIIVLSSDNGPEDYRVKNAANAGVGSTGPLRARKRSMYEGGIRTFGLVRWPGTVPAGRVDETSVVGAVDLLPTIAALAGVAVPADLAADGEDQSGVWRGGRALRNKPLHWEWLFGVQGQQDGFMPPPLAVRDGDWKLFVNHDGTGAQLYSIPNDPGESRDVAAEQPEVVKALTAKAVAWARSLPPSPARDTVASGGTVEKQMRGNKKAAGKAAATDSDAPQATAPLDRPRIFVSWDADSDGFLSREEYVSRLRGQADAPERFRRFDTDGDGRLTRDEFVRAGR